MHWDLQAVYLVLPRAIKLNCSLKHSADTACVSVTRRNKGNNCASKIAIYAYLQTLLRCYRCFKASYIEFVFIFLGSAIVFAMKWSRYLMHFVMEYIYYGIMTTNISSYHLIYLCHFFIFSFSITLWIQKWCTFFLVWELFSCLKLITVFPLQSPEC